MLERYVHGCWVVFLSLLATSVAAQPKMSVPITFTGMCDASGGVAIGTNLIAVADDEGNQLRIYRVDQGGPAVFTWDLTRFLQLTKKSPEADLEGAAWLGERIFWIGSHGRNHLGKYRPNRHCFFATTVQASEKGVRLAPVGICYRDLLIDLVFDKRYQPFHLAPASARAPKSKEALNIEGLCATADNHLLIGFRNPIPNGRALLAPLLNPNEVIRGAKAELGDPILLELGGLGVRDMGTWQEKTYIIAGPYNEEKDFKLYVWKGGSALPSAVLGINFGSLSPEALVFFPERQQQFLVLSDDGLLKIHCVDCKRLANPADRRFQAVWITP